MTGINFIACLRSHPEFISCSATPAPALSLPLLPFFGNVIYILLYVCLSLSSFAAFQTNGWMDGGKYKWGMGGICWTPLINSVAPKQEKKPHISPFPLPILLFHFFQSEVREVNRKSLLLLRYLYLQSFLDFGPPTLQKLQVWKN